MKNTCISFLILCSFLIGSGCASKTAETGVTDTKPQAAESAKEAQKTPAAPEPTEKATSAAALNVIEATVCRSVENRTPVGSGTSFPADVGSVSFFTKVGIPGGSGDATIKHVWHFDGKTMATVELPVRGAGWRTYSSKTVKPSQKGQWKVELTTEDGRVLKTIAFTIQ